MKVQIPVESPYLAVRERECLEIHSTTAREQDNQECLEVSTLQTSWRKWVVVVRKPPSNLKVLIVGS
jgi:hypothetical protein